MAASPDNPAQSQLETAGALDERHVLLEKAQEVAQIGSWVFELDGSRRLRWSPETFRVFGIPADGFDGTLDAFIALVHPDDVATVRAAALSAVENQRPLEIEHRIVTRAGDLRWIHEKADIVRDEANRAVRMIGTSQDITNRRELELQLRHAQKMDAIGRLAGGVAHDLNNALTTIAGYTELALNALSRDHPARADVEEIRRAAARAESITRKLLAFSRRQHLLESREFDLNDLVKTLARLLERTLGDNITLRTQLAPTVPLIVGDSGQVEQAVINLAVNARDAMPNGGELVISTAVEQLDDAFVRAHAPARPGRFVVLSIADTGHGLDHDTKARIFEPFFTTKEVGKGTGLGLAMVYGTVKQSNGLIVVESEAGQGATFKLYFPAVGAAPSDAPARRAPEPASASAQQPTILIVEDEPSILNLIATALRSEGYHLLKASSGTEALKVVAECDRPIALVLTDAMMPGMSGIELARTLQTTYPDVPMMMMSGYPHIVTELGPAAEGITVLEKPFTPRQLRTRVRDALNAAAQ